MTWLLAAAACCVLLLAVLWFIGERGHLILPSTRRGFRTEGWQSVFRWRSWHFYLYGRWPRQYIGLLIRVMFGVLARLGRPARQWWADRYHGKVLTPLHARKIIEVDRDIAIPDLEQVVPYRTARKMLLQTPLDIAVYDCPCRTARKVHCEPTQVCLIVGQPFVDLVLEHHPGTSRRLSRQEALELLEAEHQRGHAHIAWFKNVCLDRFFAICNCCRCCCAGIEAMLHHGIPMVTGSGFVATVDSEACLNCGRCADACLFEAIFLGEYAEVQADRCMGCGVCVDQCVSGALSLTRAATATPPLDLSALNDRARLCDTSRSPRTSPSALWAEDQRQSGTKLPPAST
jgi:Pyruvate/2-oxoacid:ferredoxin oxidoreductase delta subunit